MGWKEINARWVEPAVEARQDGRLDEAETILRQGWEATGDPFVALTHAELLEDLDRLDEARVKFQFAVLRLPLKRYRLRAQTGLDRLTQNSSLGNQTPGASDQIQNTSASSCMEDRGATDRDQAVQLEVAVQRVMRLEEAEKRRHQEILSRLPATPKETQHSIAQQLGPVSVQLPSSVMGELVKAELHYRTGTEDNQARIGFAKAIEAYLNWLYVAPLRLYMESRHLTCIALPCSRWSGELRAREVVLEKKGTDTLSRLGLGAWGEALELLATNPALGSTELLEFTWSRLGAAGLTDLSPVARSLKEVQKGRGGSAHVQEPLPRYEQERRDLQGMRALVLGIGQPSLIDRMYWLFAGSSSDLSRAAMTRVQDTAPRI